MGQINLFVRLRPVFLFLFVSIAPAYAYQNLSVNVGGGYAANLYADSFNFGNSYLVNNVAFSSTNFESTRLKLYYSVSYLEHNTNDIINNFIQVLGANLYNRDRGNRFKWGIDLYAATKNYAVGNSDFNNYRIFLVADAAYYISPALQVKGIYRDTRSKFLHFESLDYLEHRLESEAAWTLPSRTTIRGSAAYTTRMFDEDSKRFDWFEVELGASQSVDIRTGISLSAQRRFAGGGTRPISTYFILSGITPYWDPWDGYQAELSIKRILPLAIVSKAEFGYWIREFSYDPLLRERLRWLFRRAGRTDDGWLVRLGLTRQQNIGWKVGRAAILAIGGGFLSNNSDDPFYEYDNYFIDANLELRLF
jgi:hypothetical protein